MIVLIIAIMLVTLDKKYKTVKKQFTKIRLTSNRNSNLLTAK